MGQARQRAAEIARLKAREKSDDTQALEILRRKHNLPEDAKFDGYVVWIEERDEFLVQLNETPSITTRAYGGNVDAAIRFDSFDKASTHANASKHPAVVAATFDVGNQIAVVG